MLAGYICGDIGNAGVNGLIKLVRDEVDELLLPVRHIHPVAQQLSLGVTLPA